jgi:hypothetical protein
MNLVESENFVLVFLALYGSTIIQSRLFLKDLREIARVFYAKLNEVKFECNAFVLVLVQLI